MQRATDFHHQIPHAVLPQLDGVFDDATAFDAADDMFDPDSPPGKRLIGRFLRVGQRSALWLAGWTGMHDIRQGIAYKAQIISQLTARWQWVGDIVRNRLIMHAAFIRIAQQVHQTVSGRQDQVVDRVALFLAAVIVGLITCVRGARDGAFRAVVKTGDAVGAPIGSRTGQRLLSLLERDHGTGRQVTAGRERNLERHQQDMQPEIGFRLGQPKRSGMGGL